MEMRTIATTKSNSNNNNNSVQMNRTPTARSTRSSASPLDLPAADVQEMSNQLALQKQTSSVLHSENAALKSQLNSLQRQVKQASKANKKPAPAPQSKKRDKKKSESEESQSESSEESESEASSSTYESTTTSDSSSSESDSRSKRKKTKSSRKKGKGKKSSSSKKKEPRKSKRKERRSEKKDANKDRRQAEEPHRDRSWNPPPPMYFPMQPPFQYGHYNFQPMQQQQQRQIQEVCIKCENDIAAVSVPNVGAMCRACFASRKRMIGFK